MQLGAGLPNARLLPVQKLNRMLAAAARRAGTASTEYDMPPGCLALRRALARRALDWGVKILPGRDHHYVRVHGSHCALPALSYAKRGHGGN